MNCLCQKYSSFFCQQLFFYLEPSERENILILITKNVFKLVKFNSGQGSLLFIYENGITAEEQEIVVNNIKDNFSKLLEIHKFLRVTECIIGSFSTSVLHPIYDVILDKLYSLISHKEGYYIVKTMVKSVKDPIIQEKVVRRITADFYKFIVTGNGSLVVKSIIHNFPNNVFIYNKCSCNHQLDKLMSKKITQTVYNVNKMNTVAIQLLYNKLFSMSFHWNDPSLTQILEYSMQANNSIFKNMFVLKLEEELNNYSTLLLHNTLNSSSAEEIVAFVVSNLDNPKLKSVIIQTINSIKKQMQYQNLLKKPLQIAREVNNPISTNHFYHQPIMPPKCYYAQPFCGTSQIVTPNKYQPMNHLLFNPNLNYISHPQNYRSSNSFPSSSYPYNFNYNNQFQYAVSNQTSNQNLRHNKAIYNQISLNQVPSGSGVTEESYKQASSMPSTQMSHDAQKSLLEINKNKAKKN